MREAERQREEAINYAQKVQAESNELRDRMNTLDTNYVTEYSTRSRISNDGSRTKWLRPWK